MSSQKQSGPVDEESVPDFQLTYGNFGAKQVSKKGMLGNLKTLLGKEILYCHKEIQKTTGRLCSIMCPVLNFQRVTMHSTTLCFSGNQATRCNLGTTWRVKNMTQKPLAFHLGLFDFSPHSPFFTKVTICHHPPSPRSLFGPKPSPRPRSTADGCQSVLSGSLLL